MVYNLQQIEENTLTKYFCPIGNILIIFSLDYKGFRRFGTIDLALKDVNFSSYVRKSSLINSNQLIKMTSNTKLISFAF